MGSASIHRAKYLFVSRVRLININDRPVVLVNGQLSVNLSFTEGGKPVSLLEDSLLITDSDNKNLTE